MSDHLWLMVLAVFLIMLEQDFMTVTGEFATWLGAELKFSFAIFPDDLESGRRVCVVQWRWGRGLGPIDFCFATVRVCTVVCWGSMIVGIGCHDEMGRYFAFGLSENCVGNVWTYC